MPSQERVRRVVMVVGTGRSGTSTIAGILQRLGLHVPAPEVPADDSNPRGFSESQWVVDLHDELLARGLLQVADARPQAWEEAGRLGGQEQLQRRVTAWLGEQLGYDDRLLVKDPRLAWFLRLWRSCAEQCRAEASFVTMLRPPAEVVGSRRTYYNSRLGDAPGTAGWVNMMLHTEQATRDAPRAFVRYHDLLDDWRGALRAVGEALDLPEAVTPTTAQAAAVDDFVDPGLRRHRTSWEDLRLPQRMREIAEAGWAELDALAAPDGDTPQRRAALDELRAAYAAYYLEAESVSRSSAIAARAAAIATESGPAARRSVVDRIAARTPHRVRAAVPTPARRWVRRRLGG